MSKDNTGGADDFSAGLAELESEQFHDGEPYRREEDGTVVKGAALDANDEEVPADDDKVDDENAREEDDLEDENENDAEGDEEDDLEDEEGEEGDDGKKKPLSQTAKLTQALRAVRAELREIKAERQQEKVKAALPKNRDGSEMTADQYAKTEFEADPEAPKKPDPSKFKLGEFDNDYRDAYDDYLEQRREYLADLRQEYAEKFGSASNAAPVSDVQELGKKVEAFTAKAENKKVAGFDAAVEAAKKDEWPLSPVVAELILDSDIGAEITVFLHKNQKLAKEIADLSPAKQAARFGKLEDQILADKAAKAKAAKRPTAAPAPIGGARGGGNAAPKGFSSENFEDVERRWNSDQRRRAK